MKVRIFPDWSDESFRVVARREIAMETGEIKWHYLNDRLEWKSYEPACETPRDLPRITMEMLPAFADLFKELRRLASFETLVNAPVEQENEALRDHLNDMRAIAFKQLGIETE